MTDECRYRYESAIAHQLVATTAQDAATLAQCLAEGWAAWRREDVIGQETPMAIATNLSVQPTSKGALVLTVSPLGLAAWQQGWRQSPIPPNVIAADAEPAIAQSIERGNWPLCDRLQLSLPMLLQWAHGRCDTWQQALGARSPAESQSGTSDGPIDSSSIDVGASALNGMSQPLTNQLLPVVMQALDQMAARAGAPQVCLRQGYRLAEQIYCVEGQMAQWRSRQDCWLATAPLAATQKALQMVLFSVLRQPPMRHL